MNLSTLQTITLAAEQLCKSKDGWIHLLPLGSFNGRDGRGPYLANDPKSIIKSSSEYAAGRPIPIDYDHQIDHANENGSPAIAAGWIRAFEVRDDGIWGKVEWTSKASAHILAKEYCFISPVIGCLADGTVRIIMRAALTNNPNLTQLEPVVTMEAKSMDPLIIKLRKALNLPDTATEDDIVNAISATNQVADNNKPDPAKFVPIEEFQKVVAELNRINKGMEIKAAKQHVENKISDGLLPPYLREWAIELCSVNMPAFDAFVDKTKRLYEPLSRAMLTAIPPDNGNHSTLSLSEREAATHMGLTEEQFMRGKRTSQS